MLPIIFNTLKVLHRLCLALFHESEDDLCEKVHLENKNTTSKQFLTS